MLLHQVFQSCLEKLFINSLKQLLQTPFYLYSFFFFIFHLSLLFSPTTLVLLSLILLSIYNGIDPFLQYHSSLHCQFLC